MNNMFYFMFLQMLCRLKDITTSYWRKSWKEIQYLETLKQDFSLGDKEKSYEYPMKNAMNISWIISGKSNTKIQV